MAVRPFARIAGRVLAVTALALAGSGAVIAITAAVTTTTAAAAAGQLAIEAASAKATPDSSAVVVRIANTGDEPVQAITIQADGPPGVTAAPEPAAIMSLAAGSSVLATVTVRGVPESRPAALVVRATGTSGSAETAALTSIDLVAAEPASSLTLAGNTRLTDSSPAELVAVVANSADVPATVSVRATAGQHAVRLAAEGGDLAAAAPGAPVKLTVPARQSAVVLVQVRANPPLRRGSAALVVTATVQTPHAATPVDITASRDLDVALSADVLPGLLGVGSVLVIPGLVAVWAFLAVQHRDRRRIGLAPPAAASQIWDNKLWLLAAAAVSLVAAAVYSALGFADLLDTYALSDVAVVTVAAGLVAAAVAALLVWQHRRDVPAVTPRSTPLDVLAAAQRCDQGIKRRVYRAPDGKRGLLVHTDRGAVVLAPPVEFTEIDLQQEFADDSIAAAIDKIGKTVHAERKLRFRQGGDFVAGPRAILDAQPTSEPDEPILAYVNAF